MSDLDDDEIDDLFADFEETDAVDSAMISANLLDASGIDPSTVAAVHAGEADEGRITWVAPEFSGLTNSTSVDTKGALESRRRGGAPPAAPRTTGRTRRSGTAGRHRLRPAASTAAVVAEAAPRRGLGEPQHGDGAGARGGGTLGGGCRRRLAGGGAAQPVGERAPRGGRRGRGES